MKRVGLWSRRLMLGLLAFALLWLLWLFGWVLWWKWVNPGTTRFMEIRLEELQTKDPQARLKKEWVE